MINQCGQNHDDDNGSDYDDDYSLDDNDDSAERTNHRHFLTSLTEVFPYNIFILSCHLLSLPK